jgi:serine phosphatase RsbU (regulator of sigma subunit)
LEEGETILGRATNVAVTLEGSNVSRRHARVLRQDGKLFLEDLGSSNGTFVNGQRISSPFLIGPSDQIRIGHFQLQIELAQPADELTIQRQTLALAGNQDIYRENAAAKLQAVLELAHALANTLELEPLLQKFGDHLFKLLPKAERAVLVLLEGGQPVVRLVRSSTPNPPAEKLFSRSVLRRVCEEGVALLAEDVSAMEANLTLHAMGVRSVIGVPLRTRDAAVFGVLQLERFRQGQPFAGDDLNLATALALQLSTVLENARLHERLVYQERLARDLALAREIQLGFLPRELPRLAQGSLELCADLQPAEEVSGDFYDWLPLDDSRVAFLVADVSGKGMPAALFMSMARALLRQLMRSSFSPGEILTALNRGLAVDNPKYMFITVLLGIYQPTTGEVRLARGGHPLPLLRKTNGQSEEVALPAGCLIGLEEDCPAIQEATLRLLPGETLIFYTDGISEAAEMKSQTLFGTERLLEVIGKLPSSGTLPQWLEEVKRAVGSFCDPNRPQDDVTLLMLRHGTK